MLRRQCYMVQASNETDRWVKAIMTADITESTEWCPQVPDTGPGRKVPLKVTDDGETVGGREHPLNIACVLSYVMKYMNVENLKSCRLVNSIWSHEASCRLKKISVVSFDYLIREYKYKDDGSFLSKVESWSPRLSVYLETMGHWCAENYRVIIRSRKNVYAQNYNPLWNRDCTTAQLPPVLFETLFTFLGPKMKYLDYNCDSLGKYSIMMLKDTLSLNLDNLTHLRIKIHNCDGYNKTQLDSFVMETLLPSVTRLELIVDLRRGHFENEHCLMFEKVIQIFPNLTSFIVKSEEIQTGHRIMQKEFTDSMYSKLESFSNLNEVTIKFNSYPFISSLSKLPPNLKRLGLLLPETAAPLEIENLLNAQAATLEEFELIVPTLNGSIDSIAQSVQVPVFPKLRKLRIQHLGCCYTSPTPLTINFQFLDNELIYANQFPMLEELSLGNTQIMDSETWMIYEQFVPANGQVVSNIRILNVPYLPPSQVRKATMNDLQIMIRVSKMFPNIRYPCFRLVQDQYDANITEMEYTPPTLRPRKFVDYSAKKK